MEAMKKVTILYSFIILCLASLVNSSNNSRLDEKLFTSYVSMNAIGNSVAALGEKKKLEQSFNVTYTSLVDEICSFRSIQEIKLVEVKGIEKDSAVGESDNDNSEFIIKFKISVKCFDCSSSNIQLFNSYESNEEEIGKTDNTCYWNDNLLAARSDTNLAPSTSGFMQKLTDTTKSQGAISITEVLTISDSTILEEVETLSCPCPWKSFCTYTNAYIKDFWEISSGLFHNCTCKDEFYGEDGWRCERLLHCEEENWKCAPKEEGGFCVQTDHDNDDHPFYKCGCRPGFKPDLNYTQDAHGVKHCIQDEPDETLPDETLPDETLPDESRVSFSVECSANYYLSVISLNLIGDPATVSAEKEKLEKSCRAAYENSLSSECLFRSVANVTLLGFSADNGEVTALSNPTESRYLQEIIDDDNKQNNNDDLYQILSDANVFLSNDDEATSSPMDGNETETFLSDDVNMPELSFNFTLFFSFIMRCFGCPDDALLFDDASRRRERSLLRGQRLLEESDSCICELEDGSTENAEIENVAPLRNDFVEEFNEQIIIQEVETVEEAATIENKDVAVVDEIDDLNEYLDEVDTVELIEIINPTTDRPSKQEDLCPRPCDTSTQFCDVDGKCACKDGYYAPSGKGGACQDIKECLSNPYPCSEQARCIEEIGSYKCECNEGYYGDGFSCSLETISPMPTTLSPTNSPTKKPTISPKPTEAVKTPAPVTPAPTRPPTMSNSPTISNMPSETAKPTTLQPSWGPISLPPTGSPT